MYSVDGPALCRSLVVLVKRISWVSRNSVSKADIIPESSSESAAWRPMEMKCEEYVGMRLSAAEAV
jgi:hypothetical protein